MLAGRNALALAGASVTQNPRRCGTSQSLAAAVALHITIT